MRRFCRMAINITNSQLRHAAFLQTLEPAALDLFRLTLDLDYFARFSHPFRISH